MNVLFVCTANKLRSPTAETLFAAHPGIAARSAGLDPNCPCPLNAELVLWADMIFVMETRQRERIRKKFKKRPQDGAIINLNIPDEYERDQPELIELLESKVRHRIDSALAARDPSSQAR
jgi:predicted protein tyrosine phosphatase